MIETLAAALVVPNVANAICFRIDIGDRPYYTHGARYWDGDWEYISIPGHRERGHLDSRPLPAR